MKPDHIKRLLILTHGSIANFAREIGVDRGTPWKVLTGQAKSSPTQQAIDNVLSAIPKDVIKFVETINVD